MKLKELSNKEKQGIYKEFDEIREKIFKTACDSISPVGDYVMAIAKARMVANQEAESHVCTKHNITLETFSAIRDECES